MPFTKKLRDSYKGFLQILVTEFTLTKKDDGVLLELQYGNQDQCINSSSLKKELNHAVGKNPGEKEKFVREYSEFFKNNKIRSYKFVNPGFPLRHANGGVLPIVRYKNKEYFCLFLRTIFPEGWNIANGGSNNAEELYRPDLVIYREFSEELIIKDDKKKTLYIFDSDNEKVMYGTQEDLIELLTEDTKVNYKDYERFSTPLKWLNGPDNVHICNEKSKHSSGGFFINITPDDNAIELDKIAYIKLDDNASLLDGEVVRTMDDQPKRLNRIIGLFETKKLIRNINNHAFTPDVIFYDGKRENRKQFADMLQKYFVSVKNIEEEGGGNKFLNLENKYDLCPVTRKIIDKYIHWLKTEKEALDKRKESDQKPDKDDKRKFEVFISFKSQDKDIAEALFEFLEKHGNLKVFNSSKSLEQMGESSYADAIDKALDSSRFMIVVCTRPEYFYSGWMSYEWRSFINEIHSGRKEKGHVFTLTTDIDQSEIPISLRQRQNFIYQKSDPYTSFDSILSFIKNSR